MASAREDRELREAILGLLSTWQRLPESDLVILLSAELRLRFEWSFIDALAREQVVHVLAVGDERVIALIGETTPGAGASLAVTSSG